MAVDKTEPPIKVILTVAGLSLTILVTLRVFFVSYFNSAYDHRAHQNIDAMLQGGSYIWTAARVRAEEERRLGRLSSAMSSVAQGQRPGAISPVASTDTAALAGWTLMPREVPRPAPPPAPAAPPVEAAPAMPAAPAAAAPAAAAPTAAAPTAAAPTAAVAAPAAGAH